MLNRIIDEIEKSIKNEYFIAALALALTIPDICGKAEFPNEKSINSRYIRWYNEYIGQYEKSIYSEYAEMPYVSGEVVYNLRNALLHQGTPNVDKSKIREERCKVDHFVLTISASHDGGSSGVNAYGLNPDGNEPELVVRYMTVNIVNLCDKLTRVARKYYEENQDKFDFFDYELKDIRKPPICFEYD